MLLYIKFLIVFNCFAFGGKIFNIFSIFSVDAPSEQEELKKSSEIFSELIS